MKARIALKQTQRAVFHKTLGIGACVRGDLRKLRFLLGGGKCTSIRLRGREMLARCKD